MVRSARTQLAGIASAMAVHAAAPACAAYTTEPTPGRHRPRRPRRTITPIDGATVRQGQGMVLEGRRLIVADYAGVSVVELSEDVLHARVVGQLRDPSFRATASVVHLGDRYLVVNAGGSAAPPPDTCPVSRPSGRPRARGAPSAPLSGVAACVSARLRAPWTLHQTATGDMP